MPSDRVRLPRCRWARHSDEAWRAARRRAGGYTLIEAVVAIAVVTVGLLGIFQVLASTISTNVDARNRSFATRFAEKQLEAMRSDSFAYVTTTEDNTDPALTRRLGPNATWSMTVTDINFALKGVTLTVKWSHEGREESVSLSSLSHEGGIAFIRYRWANGAGSIK